MQKRKRTRKTRQKRAPAAPATPPRSPERDDASDVDENTGNIRNLIVSDSETEQPVPVREPQTKEEEAKQLIEEFPYSPSLLRVENNDGPRRSKRARKETKRYWDDSYTKTFLSKGGKLTKKDIENIYEEEDDEDPKEEEDDDYEESDDDEEDDDNVDIYVGVAIGC